jgi:FKBP-type peptidyl-prolyl cis-trans isomerase FkpA
MKLYLPHTIALSLALFFVVSCGNPKKQEEVLHQEFDEAKAREQLLNVQKPSLVMEQDIIESYIKQHQLQMQMTGTGLRYQIVKANPKGKAIISTNIVKVKYKVLLLDGTLCYSSDKNGPKTFKVDFDNVETGIHQGIKLLHEGEKAVFILPSHLAHGLTGDDNMIPPKASVYYEVEVMSVRE